MSGRTHLDWALVYLARHWGVLPLHEWTGTACSCGKPDCGDPAKHPRIAWAEYQQKLPAEDEVRKWWRQWPTANIGILTGAVSGILGIDVDGQEGYASLKAGGTLRATPVATTGKGEHIYCQYPGAGIGNKVRFAPGLDLRGEAGYLVAPPSVHASGRVYAWRLSPENVPLAPAPDWLLKMIGLAGAAAGEKAPNPDGWVREALLGVTEGQRNQTAAKLIGHYLRQGIASEEITALLLLWDANNRPPLGAERVRDTVLSVVTTAVDRLNGRRNFNIERIVKIDSRPAVYYVTVMGVDVLMSAEDLCQFSRFQRRVFEATNQAPVLRDVARTWIPFLNTVLTERLELILAPDEARREAPVWYQVVRYLAGRATEDESALAEDRGPYANETHIYFKAGVLFQHLRSRQLNIEPHDLWDLVRRQGGENLEKRAKDSGGKSRVVFCWRLPKAALTVAEDGQSQ